MYKLLSNKHKAHGFTLIELLIVVAAIAIPQFAIYRQKTFDSAASADIKNCKTALEVYHAEKTFYPH